MHNSDIIVNRAIALPCSLTRFYMTGYSLLLRDVRDVLFLYQFFFAALKFINRACTFINRATDTPSDSNSALSSGSRLAESYTVFKQYTFQLATVYVSASLGLFTTIPSIYMYIYIYIYIFFFFFFTFINWQPHSW